MEAREAREASKRAHLGRAHPGCTCTKIDQAKGQEGPFHEESWFGINACQSWRLALSTLAPTSLAMPDMDVCVKRLACFDVSMCVFVCDTYQSTCVFYTCLEVIGARAMFFTKP